MFNWVLDKIGRSQKVQSYETRQVFINERDANSGFPNNRISNTKYTIITFLPKNLLEQFGRFMNIYFLMIACFQLVPALAPVNPATTWVPLGVIFALSALKEGIDDYFRYKADKAANERLYWILSPSAGRKIQVKAEDIQVGQLVYLRENDEVPCDLVILKTADAESHMAYVQTANLDGETDLKTRVAVRATATMSEEELLRLSGIIECASPNAEIYKFDSRLKINKTTSSSASSLKSSSSGVNGTSIDESQPTAKRNHSSNTLGNVSLENIRASVGSPPSSSNSRSNPYTHRRARSSGRWLPSPDDAAVDFSGINNNPDTSSVLVINENPATSDDNIVGYRSSTPHLNVLNLSDPVYSHRRARSLGHTSFGPNEIPINHINNDDISSPFYIPQRKCNKLNDASETSTISDLHISLDPSHTAWQATKLKNIAWIVGVAVYTGNETKVGMNKNVPPSKWTKADRVINRSTIAVFVLQIVLTLLLGITGDIWQAYNGPRHWYLSERLNNWYDWLIIPIRFLLLMSLMIPISLKVTLDIVKYVYALLIDWDMDMVDPESGIGANCNSSALSEDLGQIDFLFSDKTGTLTENNMVFSQCSIDHVIYDGKSKLKGKSEESSEESVEDENSEDLSTESEVDGKNGNNTKKKITAANDPVLRDLLVQGNPLAYDFCRILALCNTALPVADENEHITWKCASPDEEALVGAAADLGFVLVSSHGDVLKLEIDPTATPYSERAAIASKKSESSQKASSLDQQQAEEENQIPTTEPTRPITSSSKTSTHLKSIKKGKRSPPKPHPNQESVATGMESSDEEIDEESGEERDSPEEQEEEEDDIESSVVDKTKPKQKPRRRKVAFEDQIEQENDSDDEENDPSSLKTIEKYTVLHILEFTSDRKRMSVLLRNHRTNQLVLLMKGADDKVLAALAPKQNKKKIIADVEYFAQLGLRTLCLCQRIVSETEYARWSIQLNKALTDMKDRPLLVAEAYSELEKDFQFVGITAIEDKLQQGVPETIELLRQAGIKIWMLTGDKHATAVQIATSCNLISPNSVLTGEVFSIEGKTFDSALASLNATIAKVLPLTRGMGATTTASSSGVRLNSFFDQPQAYKYQHLALKSVATGDGEDDSSGGPPNRLQRKTNVNDLLVDIDPLTMTSATNGDDTDLDSSRDPMLISKHSKLQSQDVTQQVILSNSGNKNIEELEVSQSSISDTALIENIRLSTKSNVVIDDTLQSIATSTHRNSNDGINMINRSLPSLIVDSGNVPKSPTAVRLRSSSNASKLRPSSAASQQIPEISSGNLHQLAMQQEQQRETSEYEVPQDSNYGQAIVTEEDEGEYGYIEANKSTQSQQDIWDAEQEMEFQAQQYYQQYDDQQFHQPTVNPNTNLLPHRSLPGLATGAGGKRELSLVVEGTTLTHLLRPACKARFLQLALQAHTVICCRVTPQQKAQVVELVKHGASGVAGGKQEKTTLAIGDGGNDVSMIQTASVGVGLVGREGLQASRAADFSLAKFRFLSKLILVHGRWSYRRTAFVAHYCFHKSLFLAFMQIFYAFFSGFAGTSLFDSFSLGSYNVLFTALPILFFSMDKDINEQNLLLNPQLYHETQSGRFINTFTLLYWFIRSAGQSAMVFFCMILLPNVTRRHGQPFDMEALSTMAYGACVIVQTLTIFIESNQLTFINHIVIWGTLLVYIICMIVLNFALPTMNGVIFALWSDPVFWFGIILAVFGAMIPVVALRFFMLNFFPTRSQLVQRLENLSEHEYGAFAESEERRRRAKTTYIKDSQLAASEPKRKRNNVLWASIYKRENDNTGTGSETDDEDDPTIPPSGMSRNSQKSTTTVKFGHVTSRFIRKHPSTLHRTTPVTPETLSDEERRSIKMQDPPSYGIPFKGRTRANSNDSTHEIEVLTAKTQSSDRETPYQAISDSEDILTLNTLLTKSSSHTPPTAEPVIIVDPSKFQIGQKPPSARIPLTQRALSAESLIGGDSVTPTVLSTKITMNPPASFNLSVSNPAIPNDTSPPKTKSIGPASPTIHLTKSPANSSKHHFKPPQHRKGSSTSNSQQAGSSSSIGGLNESSSTIGLSTSGSLTPSGVTSSRPKGQSPIPSLSQTAHYHLTAGHAGTLHVVPLSMISRKPGGLSASVATLPSMEDEPTQVYIDSKSDRPGSQKRQRSRSATPKQPSGSSPELVSPSTSSVLSSPAPISSTPISVISSSPGPVASNLPPLHASSPIIPKPQTDHVDSNKDINAPSPSTPKKTTKGKKANTSLNHPGPDSGNPNPSALSASNPTVN